MIKLVDTVNTFHLSLRRGITNEPHRDKTNKVAMRPAKTQISLGIRPVWSESLLSAWRKLESSATKWAHSEDSDQTGRIWVFAGRTVSLLVLSRSSSDTFSVSIKANGSLGGLHPLCQDESGSFRPLSLSLRVVSPPGSFRPLSLSPRVVSPPGRFAHFPVRSWVVSPPYKILFLVLLFRPQKWY